MNLFDDETVTIEDVQLLLATGDPAKPQQVWVTSEGEVTLADPTGALPSDLQAKLYCRSQILAAGSEYVGPNAAMSVWVFDVWQALKRAQRALAGGTPLSTSDPFWLV
jgi:hypothetical protein